MLFWLIHWLSHFNPWFKTLDALSIRCALVAMTAFLIVILLGRPFIKFMQKKQMGQIVRKDGPATHFDKSGTPTMGGLLVVLGILVSMILWSNLSSPFVWLMICVLVSFSIIGFADDYLKIKHKNSEGLSAKGKLLAQSVLAIIFSIWMYGLLPESAHVLIIPFVAHVSIQLGAWFILLSYFMITGFSNGVNLTDGLDGLAIVPTVLIALALVVMAVICSNSAFADLFHLPLISGGMQVGLCASALAGAGLGFLWFNAYPARVFMGDVGSLSIGAILAVLAILIRQEIIFMVMGGIFIAETFSVALQITSFKLFKKRVFRMAPLHHHFELKGWPEPRVAVRFWIVTIILVLIGLLSIKLR